MSGTCGADRGDGARGAVVRRCTKLLNEKRLLTEVCWVISNVTAGESSQIQAVIDEGILTKMHRAVSQRRL
jgi:hypothetical protein